MRAPFHTCSHARGNEYEDMASYSPTPSLNSTEDCDSDMTIDLDETQAILPPKPPTRPKRIRNLPAHITKTSVVQPSVKHTTGQLIKYHQKYYL